MARLASPPMFADTTHLLPRRGAGETFNPACGDPETREDAAHMQYAGYNLDPTHPDFAELFEHSELRHFVLVNGDGLEELTFELTADDILRAHEEHVATHCLPEGSLQAAAERPYDGSFDRRAASARHVTSLPPERRMFLPVLTEIRALPEAARAQRARPRASRTGARRASLAHSPPDRPRPSAEGDDPSLSIRRLLRCLRWWGS